ncbi:MAG: RagB/SusD family nutrient uptake outer membrane protein [Bacteroidales bacterium]|nr:RagB/SusD family nutrient uptake outer membrane protein [Bacteroidales bacterium]
MKKILYFAAVAVCASLVSCESFLDTTNYWSKTTEDFPANQADAEQILTGIYNNLNVSIGNNVHQNHFLWSLAASDDCLGGGGANDQAMQAHDLLLNFGANLYEGFYKDRYTGIARANVAIETFKNCGLDEATLNQYLGEAYFLRAWYYYELASMFGNIPCPVTSSADATQPQISGEALWGQILQDAKTAADIMPSTVTDRGNGHVDKYCAEALLGRAYLFYSGFYGDEDVTLPNGETLTKADVQAAITDCVNNSGYSLVPEYHNLWSYTNRICVEDDLSPWKGNGYEYVNNDGGVNPEAMFIIKFNTQPSWGTTIGYSNQTALFMGVRGQSADQDHFPFGTGWGMCPVNPSLVADWKATEPNDPRLDASIISVDKWNYKYGGDSNIQETGYYQTKTMPVIGRKADGSGFWKSYVNEMYPGLTWSEGNEDNFQLNLIDDMVMIRFAEVLLMDAELNNNQASFDAVRARAGLPSKPITEENIRNERRWELAFEGVRYGDMRRYGEAYAVAALDKQEGVACYNSGVQGTNHAAQFNGGYGQRYSKTKGFVALPSAQISLSASAGEQYKYQQNEGWGSTDSEFAGWQ